MSIFYMKPRSSVPSYRKLKKGLSGMLKQSHTGSQKSTAKFPWIRNLVAKPFVLQNTIIKYFSSELIF